MKCRNPSREVKKSSDNIRDIYYSSINVASRRTSSTTSSTASTTSTTTSTSRIKRTSSTERKMVNLDSGLGLGSSASSYGVAVQNGYAKSFSLQQEYGESGHFKEDSMEDIPNDVNHGSTILTNEETESQKFTFLQACGMNTMFMFGTGPLITVPYCIAAVYKPSDPRKFDKDAFGPYHALIGYSIALIGCICDSFVCAEIGSMWPYSGGTSVYLRELFGSRTWGKLMAFLYIFQFLFSGPAEVASGFIAISDYLVYFNPNIVDYWNRVGLSLSLLGLSTWLLYRNNKDIGYVSNILTGVTIFAMLFTLIAGFSDWHIEYLNLPSNIFNGGNILSNIFGNGMGNSVGPFIPASSGENVGTVVAESSHANSTPSSQSSSQNHHFSKILLAIYAATRFGVYDMTGYYDVCFMGEEVQNPKINIPKSCIATCVIVGIICIAIYIAILGRLDYSEWIGNYTLDGGTPIGIMSLFTEHATGSVFLASIMTIIVACTIFGSVFSMMCGFAFLLFAASRDGFFYQYFNHKHEKYESLPDRALLTISFLASLWCFFSISIVIEAMTTLLVLVQFLGQSFGLLWYRYRTPIVEQPDGWRMPLYPLPCLLQIILFLTIFLTSPSMILYGSEKPILELCVFILICGSCLFLARSVVKKDWPFYDIKIGGKNIELYNNNEIRKNIEYNSDVDEVELFDLGNRSNNISMGSESNNNHVD